MKKPDFAATFQVDKNHIKIHVTGQVPGPKGWADWGETYWIPQVHLPRIETKFQGVRKIKVRRLG